MPYDATHWPNLRPQPAVSSVPGTYAVQASPNPSNLPLGGGVLRSDVVVEGTTVADTNERENYVTTQNGINTYFNIVDMNTEALLNPLF